MIPTATRDTKISGNLRGQEMAMVMDENSLIHLQAVLSNLYEDPEMAVIREYCVNALDSHITARNPSPIEVFLPSRLSPNFRVKDLGVGLSLEDIKDILRKYGASTKRETNEVTGSLGLGSKSALTLSESFSYVCVKDGRKATINISRNEDDGAKIIVLSDIETEEPNGVEVIIPVGSGYASFAEKARSFFSFWKKGTALIDGEPIEGLKEGIEVAPGVFLVSKTATDHYSREYERSCVVMGNVPYEISEPQYAPLPSSHHYKVVAYAPMGAVHFTPSREALKMTRLTKQYLDDLTKLFETGLQDTIQKAIQNATTSHEAYGVIKAWKNSLPQGHAALENLSYKGKEVPHFVEYEVDSEGRQERFVISNATSQKLSEHNRQTRIKLDTLADALQAIGDVGEFTASHKRKLEKYAQDHGIPANHYVVGPKPLADDWVDPVRIVPWDQIKDIKLPRKTGGLVQSYGARLKGSYDLWRGSSYKETEVPAESIDAWKPLFYFVTDSFSNNFSPASRYFECLDKHAVALAQKLFPDCTVVRLGGNRITKFQRDFPTAKELCAALVKAHNDLVAAITDEEKEAQRLRNEDIDTGRILKSLCPGRIRDGALRDLINRVDHPLPRFDRLAEFHLISNYLKRIGQLEPYGVVSKKDAALEAYPLLSYIDTNSLDTDHTYLYIEAAYVAQKGNHLR